MRTAATIHRTATLGEHVVLGAGTRVGPGAVIHDGVSLGAESQVGPNVVLGEPLAASHRDTAYVNPPLTIGERAVLRSGTVIYAGSTIGEAFETGHHAIVREGATIGVGSRVGSSSEVLPRATVGDYVRVQGSVVLSPDVVIGDFAWIFPFTFLTDDPYPPSELAHAVHVAAFAVIGAHSLVLPGVCIGRDALVAAGSLVANDVADEEFVRGRPARRVCSVREIRSRATGTAMYPWREHFDRGMPWQGVGYDAWLARRP